MSIPRALSFDAGNTLLYIAPSVGEVYAEVTRRFGGTATPAQLEQWFFEGWDRSAPRRGTPEDPLASSAAIEYEMWTRIARHVYPHLDGIQAGFETWFGALYESFGEGGSYALYPDALACLEACRARGLKMAVCSNWDPRLHAVIRGLGLGEFMEGVLLSAEVGRRKPAREMFDRTAEALRCRPEEVLHVGDTWSDDVEGALAAGMRACWLNRDGSEAPPGGNGRVLQIKSLGELVAMTQ
ncbi:MAG: HAD-IA family hydrolase [Planctomycetes bacterium]|nr:HAD-IA family hydrolase [Planctomycetota bacterium]